MGGQHDIPSLKNLNLCVSDTAGFGNCLFHSLSDQLYGHQSSHAELRAATTEYMRANATHFKSFICVHPGGGTRRSERVPKRKNPGALARPEDSFIPTAEQINTAFEKHLTSMQKGGEYGDNLEITAFANCFKVNVYIFSEAMNKFLLVKCEDDSEVTKTAYIAHHTWEHYSSIRNTTGPKTGLPNVVFMDPSDKAEDTRKETPAEHSYAKQWMIDEIQQGLPYNSSREAIVEALVAYKGNMNNAISCLMPTSSQSSSRSSSIERILDSDDEIDNLPKKKADRRPSRPQPLRLGKSNKKFPVNSEDSNSVSPDPSQLSAALSKLTGDDVINLDTDEEDPQIESPYKDSGTTSVSTVASESSGAGKGKMRPIIRIKLSQPKKPVEKAQPSHMSSNKLTHTGEYDADGEKAPSPKIIAKPRRRLISGLEREKLRAEKSRNTSPRTSIMKARKVSRRTSLSPTSANSKNFSQSPPVVDDIKILRI